MPRLKITSAAAVASILLLGLPISAYALVDDSTSMVSQTPPSVIVFNQKPKEGEINVTYAYLPSAGHLVIHGSNSSGKANDSVIGSTKLDAGAHNNVTVKLDKNVADGTSLWASLTNADKRPFWKTSLPLQNEFLIK
ncbi:MAG: hypothetical protein QM780_12200 [Hyphomicrobium sp.]|uniref:DUF7282 domain-containing protein n=1 Tax=Hyphomicrobium sp. TaxID=82 RepID=UPI0039E50E29